MYGMTTRIPFVHAGDDGLLKLHEAVAMMMNVCQSQDSQETAFRDYLASRHLAVFLFSMQLDIFRRPAFRENVRTEVRIYGCRSLYGLRQITMRDEAQNLLMIANATGAFFDTEARRAVKLDPDELGVAFDEPRNGKRVSSAVGTRPGASAARRSVCRRRPTHL
ncbi:MAG: thioesterase [Victivallaceae bacterium]|nr:thioesterase [Victivallaceae bacterium]